MLQKSSIWKTTEVFFIEPTQEFSLLDISRKSKLAHTSTKQNLKILLKEEIITEKILKKGKRKFPVYKSNLNNEIYKKYKKVYNLTSVLESALIEYLRDTFNPNSIVLFGSYQRGEDTEESDIDIYLECNPKDINLEKYEKKLQRKIQLHHTKDFSKYPKELKNNIINGIVLFGYLEGYK